MSIPHELWRLGLADLASAIRGRQVSSREVVQAHIDRIAVINGRVNAVSAVLQEQALRAAAACATPLNAVLELGGGERLPAAQMFARVRASLPFATLGVPLPRTLLRVAALHPALRGPIARLDADLVADNATAIALLAVTPRAFAPDARCWGL
ncbi:hypothetical protein [Metallibacterium sp.]|uniref:hypothetical protein n=1 Tax=Metallibacterium sp. TaxID=2940281 RepID=UPI00260360E5|nr:hypothetical protein [Metallibacterium sp.]